MRKLLILFCLLFASSLSAQIWGRTYHSNYIAISRGDISGKTAVIRAGHNASIASSYETLWDGSTLYSYITNGQTLRIVGKSTDDDTSGTGALTMKITGLDSDYDIATETISLGGTDTVTTTEEFVRIWDCEIITAGTGGQNAGIVEVWNASISAADTLLATMTAGENRTNLPLFTVPDGYNFYLVGFDATQAVVKQTHLNIMARPLDEVFRPYYTSEIYTNSYSFIFPMIQIFEEKTDIELRAKTVGASGNMAVNFYGWYEEN